MPIGGCPLPAPRGRVGWLGFVAGSLLPEGLAAATDMIEDFHAFA